MFNADEKTLLLLALKMYLPTQKQNDMFGVNSKYSRPLCKNLLKV